MTIETGTTFEQVAPPSAKKSAPPPPERVVDPNAEAVKTLSAATANERPVRTVAEAFPKLADMVGGIARAPSALMDKMGEYSQQASTAPPPNGVYTPSGASLGEVVGNAASDVSSAVAARNSLTSNYVGDGPTDPSTNGRVVTPPVGVPEFLGGIYNKMVGNPVQAALNYLPDYNSADGVNVKASVPPTPADPFAFRMQATPTPAGAPAPPVPPATTPAATTPAAPAATPATPAATTPAAPAPTPEVQRLIAAQNASRTPVSDPYSGPAAAPMQAGMPAPGTPRASTWQEQAAAMDERERYADQQTMQQGYFNMMREDQSFRQQAYLDAMKQAKSDAFFNEKGTHPSVLAAVANMAGQGTGAAAPAGAAGRGMVDINGATIQQRTAQSAQQVAARGQDLDLEGRKVAAAADTTRAGMQAAVAREGQQSSERIHAGDRESRSADVVAANEAKLQAAGMSAEASKRLAMSKGISMTDGSVVYPDGTKYIPPTKGEDGKMRPAMVIQLPRLGLN